MARRTVTISKDIATGGELIPEGTYEAIISNVKEQKVKNGKNAGEDMYAIECKITEGDFKGRKATKYVMLFGGETDKAFISLYQLLSAIGEPIDFGDDENIDIEIPEPADLVGEELQIKIIHEPYKASDGEEKMAYRLDRFLPLGDAPKKSSAPASRAKAAGKQRVKI